MKRQDLTRKKLPDSPGVYYFLGKNREILYIGRATSLRERVKSYFSRGLSETRGPQISEMAVKAAGIDFKKTDSVLEAILLESDLIKKFQPPYNIREKDDKSFNCVVITDEDFPRVLLVRKKDIDFQKLKTANFKLSTFFGPFPHGARLKDALKIIRRIFPYRDNKCAPGQGRSCFNRQIGLCPGVCTGEISKADYARVIRDIKLFFSGKKTRILKNLKRQMAAAARAREFERAGEIKKTVFALEHIQDVSLLTYENHANGNEIVRKKTRNFRIEAYDVAHISGNDSVGAMVVLENGLAQKSDYRKFKIKGDFGNNDTASLKEIIEWRLAHKEWPMPDLFVADGGEAQKRIIEKALEERGLSVPVAAVTKNERHRPEKILGYEAAVRKYKREILLANSEAHRFAIGFHRQLRPKNQK